MGKAWDGSGIANDVGMWREVLRVLKPGGHLLAFGGSRTYHRLACAIEDAGFEIRDQIMWLYGSGFPKSLDVGKAIDRAAGVEREVIGDGDAFGRGSMRNRSRVEQGYRPTEINPDGGVASITAPATEAARRWQGWGTALKPAHEPIVVARKPLCGTVAENVLAFGTGAINVDGCRVGTDVRHVAYTSLAPCHGNRLGASGTAEARRGTQGEPQEYIGRWPANVIHDGSDEVLAGFPETTSTGGMTPGFSKREGWARESHADWKPSASQGGFRDTGSAARFFYTPKADATDRDQGLEGFARGDYGGVGMRGHSPEPYNVRVHAPDPNVIAAYLKQWRECAGLTKGQADEAIGGSTLYSWFEGRPAGTQLPTPETWLRLKELFGFDDTHDEAMTAVRLEEKSGFDNSKARGNHHPTVKPTELMRYLCRLVTQPGGVVLDTFMGSGSTGKAAVLERFDFIGIEREAEYLEIARARIAWLGVAPSVDGNVAPPAPVTATGAQLALEFA